MLRSRRQWSASWLSARILRCTFQYAICVGFVCFRVKRNRINGDLVAEKRIWFKWFCQLFRILMCYFYFQSYQSFVSALNISHLKILVYIRMTCTLILAIVILVIQIWYEKQVIRVVNSFLRLFRRVRALPGCQATGFGGKRELTLLLFAVLCLLYESCYMFPALFADFQIILAVTAFLDIYGSLSALMISHICFVGYLSLGTLNDQINLYVRQELRQQLSNLKKSSRKELKSAGYRLDECLAIYDDIQRTGKAFQQLFEFPLCLVLLFGFINMALVAYFIMVSQYNSISMWLLEVKSFMDMLLLTLAIHGAASSSRVVRRLSLENYYISESNDWHKKMEMFLSRLNYHEIRVRPLGLFEVSNELILMFLSGMVTYLTYIIQNGMTKFELQPEKEEKELFKNAFNFTERN